MKKLIFLLIIFCLAFIFLFKGENVFFISLRPGQGWLYQLNKKEVLSEDFCRELKIENVSLRKAQAENKVLREHLNFLEENKLNFVLAKIIGQKSEASFNWFLINQGKDKNLKKGLAVVDQQGVLVGKIIKVEDFVSYLMPVFDPRFSLAVDIISLNQINNLDLKDQNDSQTIAGILEGEYGSILKIKYVPLDREIKIGDAVITSGLEENIRSGISIGQVAEINKEPNALFQDIIVQPLLDPGFKIVAVILTE
jgi:rod shape-determining protein MreC